MEKQQEHKPLQSTHERFQIYQTSKLQSISSIEIFSESINIQFLNRQISWLDILGIKPYKQEKILIQVELLLFIKKQKWRKGLVRSQQQIVFYVMPQHLEKLLLKIRRLMTQSSIDQPKILIMYNPISGSSSKHKLNRGIDFLNKTHFSYEVITTKYKGHCTEYLKQHKPSTKNYWGVAIFSGDGLVHQFVNAHIDIPLIHIPAGSGNAFAKSQATFSNQNCGIQQNLFIAMKNKTIKIPAMEVQLQKKQQKVYSILSIQWALIADLDMESQFLRCLGFFRFEVMAAWRYMFLRTYRAIISISQTSINLPDINEPITSSEFTTYESDIYNFLLMMKPYIGQKACVTPHLTMNSNVMDLQICTDKTSRFQLLKYLLSFETGGQFNEEDKSPAYDFNHNLIKSFRLQPISERLGVIGIDGQQFQGQKIQGKILPDCVTIFSLN